MGGAGATCCGTSSDIILAAQIFTGNGKKNVQQTVTFNSHDERKIWTKRRGHPQSNMEIVEMSSAGFMPNVSRHEQSKKYPSRVALRTYRECPCCKRTLMRHTLLYRHHCKGGPEVKEKALLERMDERIRQRIAPFSEADVELDCPQSTAG